MKVFVAGGGGILGRRVVRRLSDSGHDVVATARDTAAKEPVARAGAVPVDVDLFEAGVVRRSIAACDAVLRLTTKIPPLMQMRRAVAWEATGRLRNESAALIATACVAEGVGVYVHESVSFVYADGGAAPLRDALSGEANAGILTGWKMIAARWLVDGQLR